MRFFHKEPEKAGSCSVDLPRNEAGLIGWRSVGSSLAASVFGGVLFALALPPDNYAALGILSLVPLVMATVEKKPWFAALCGYAWGFGWSIPAFFWLREIHPAVPYLMAPVISLWPMVWAWTLPFIWRNLAYPVRIQLEGDAAMTEYAAKKLSGWRILGVAAAMAAWWVVLEASRSTMLPWNNLSTTMWRVPRMLAMVSVTGQYGLGFLLALIGVALGLGLKFRTEARRLRIFPATAALALAWLVPELVLAYQAAQPPRPKSQVSLRAGAVQGDISQRRNASREQAEEALQIYLDLSRKLLSGKDKMDVVIWPETAVPYAFRGNHEVSERYRAGVRALQLQYDVPFFLGTIEFAEQPGTGKFGITNSALLISPDFRPLARYDKIHRVPFGEYIPFRALLPGFLIRQIDMNRDLVPGNDFSPVELKPGVRAGIAICFESVFPYVAREEARRGANMLLVISNDAWYPTSHEPEQHLANAVMRSVETGLPSLRCGNNGGTLVVSPDGVVRQVLETPGTGRMATRRGRAAGVLEIPVEDKPELTIYTRYGDWVIGLGALGFAGALGLAVRTWYRRKKHLVGLNGEEGLKHE